MTLNYSHEDVLSVITRKIDYLFNNQIKAGKTTKHRLIAIQHTKNPFATKSTQPTVTLKILYYG